MRVSYSRWAVLVLVAACGGTSRERQHDEGAFDPGPIGEESIDSAISTTCSGLVQLPCAGPLSERDACEANLHDSRGEAIEEGCGAEWDGLVRCVASYPLRCEGETLQVVSACEAQNDAFNACADVDVDPPPPAPGRPPGTGGTAGSGGDDPGCGLGYGPGPSGVRCSHECPGYAATCEGPNQYGPLSCSCTAGPAAGHLFEASDCSAGLIAASERECGGTL